MLYEVITDLNKQAQKLAKQLYEAFMALDLRGRFVSLRVRVDAAERLAGAELRLASSEGSFAIDVPVFVDPPMNLLQSGEWIDLTFSLGAARPEGRPDRGAIERVEWRLSERTDPGPHVTGWVGGLDSHALPEEGVVSFSFDDGYDDRITSYNVCYTKLLRRSRRRARGAGPSSCSRAVRPARA